MLMSLYGGRVSHLANIINVIYKHLSMGEITILFLGQSGLSDSKEIQKHIFLFISVFNILKYLLYTRSIKNLK